MEDDQEGRNQPYSRGFWSELWRGVARDVTGTIVLWVLMIGGATVGAAIYFGVPLGVAFGGIVALVLVVVVFALVTNSFGA